MGDLATDTGFGTIEPIQSNELPVCLGCGVSIDSDNDSGWEGFTEDGRTTQPVCIDCDKKRSSGGIKHE